MIVSLGGSWCPNCHDEAKFLQPYYRELKAKGLEIVYLQFEHFDTFAEAVAENRLRLSRLSHAFGAAFDNPDLVPLLRTGDGPQANDPLYPELQPAADDPPRPLALLAHALAFRDPRDGTERRFVSTRTLDAPTR